ILCTSQCCLLLAGQVPVRCLDDGFDPCPLIVREPLLPLKFLETTSNGVLDGSALALFSELGESLDEIVNMVVLDIQAHGRILPSSIFREARVLVLLRLIGSSNGSDRVHRRPRRVVRTTARTTH